MSGPGGGYHLEPRTVHTTGSRLHNVGTGFDGEWQAVAAQIEAQQAHLGRGRLGAAAMPKLVSAGQDVGRVAGDVGGTLSGVGAAIQQSVVQYEHSDRDSAAGFGSLGGPPARYDRRPGETDLPDVADTARGRRVSGR